MRRFYLFIFTSLVLLSEPYKPYPIIFVHGIGSDSKTWGAPTVDPKNDRSEWICKDSVLAHPEGTFYHFLELMQPYAIAWDAIDESYTAPGDASPEEGYYPNKCFLEVVNIDLTITIKGG